MDILRILLLPISILYGLIIQLRNLLYDLRILRIHKFNKAVISIGNITAGGTGKTPFTIYLANTLIDLGKKVAVVSRGYGRQSKGFFLISDGIEHKGNTKKHGDEPVLISLLTPKAVVAVCEKRSKAIEQLNRNHDIDLFIMDDGFQHRSVHRDIDIILLKGKDEKKNKLPLPSGFLREFFFNVKRADIIIDWDANSYKWTSYHTSYQIENLYDVDFIKQSSLEKLTGTKCVAFAAIANPAHFKKSLQANHITISEFIPYKDHYYYSAGDIQSLIKKCINLESENLLCTQKDLVKIKEIEGLKDLLKNRNVNLYATGLKVTLNNESSFLKKIESRLD